MTKEPTRANKLLDMVGIYREDEPHTSPRVKELAAKGLAHAASLTDAETAELCGSVMRHITRHENKLTTAGS